MSASEDHHDHGAHEVDSIAHRRLFNLLFGLSAVTLLACIAVIELFNSQVDGVEAERAAEGTHVSEAYKAKVRAVAEGYGTITVREADGAETPRFFVPVADARKQLLADPKLLQAGRPYAAWSQTDTYKAIEEAGGMPGSKPVPVLGAEPSPAQPPDAKPTEPPPAALPAEQP